MKQVKAQLASIATFLSALVVFAGAVPASAQTVHHVNNGTTIEIGDVKSIVMRVPHPKGSLVLLVGGDGILDVSDGANFTGNADSVLIRNRDAFAAEGLNVLLVEKGTDLGEAVRFMRGPKGPVTVVATSAGTPRAAKGLASGARPDRLILTSGFLTPESGPGEAVSSILGSPSLLPATLIIHHRHDACRFTSPNGVAPFLVWSGKRARVKWLDGGNEGENPCRSDAHHGFSGQDREFVSLIARFARR